MAKCHYISKQKVKLLIKNLHTQDKQVITKNKKKYFLSENTTIRAGPIVLNDTSHSTAHEAGKRSASMGR
jgi:hypothetical protein